MDCKINLKIVFFNAFNVTAFLAWINNYKYFVKDRDCQQWQKMIAGGANNVISHVSNISQNDEIELKS